MFTFKSPIASLPGTSKLRMQYHLVALGPLIEPSSSWGPPLLFPLHLQPGIVIYPSHKIIQNSIPS